ncbi:hypothetical protein [Tychonema sp. LEGE 07203]|nr:hypothetical protein [Tychonema sp. LEGE 07203]
MSRGEAKKICPIGHNGDFSVVRSLLRPTPRRLNSNKHPPN